MAKDSSPLVIKVPARPKLPELESLLTQISSRINRPIEVFIPADMGPGFSCDTCFASLIATAGANNPSTIVERGIQSRSPTEYEKRFAESLDGLACIVYAQKIVTSARQRSALPPESILQTIEDREGVLEPEPSNTLTVCAIDDDLVRQPLCLASTTNKDELKHYVNEKIRTTFGTLMKETPSDARDSNEEQLAIVVSELFENTYQHGCLSSTESVMRGLRYFRIRRHIAPRRSDFINRADGFPELQEYFQSRFPERGSRRLRLVELSIGDQGLGILNRFISTKPNEENPSTKLERIALLNRIVVDALTSKLNQRGAGRGIRNALEAIRGCNGFVSLRTENLWLYDSAALAAGPDGIRQFRSVEKDRVGTVSGTYFNILIQI